MRSTHKLAVIVAHSYVHELAIHNLDGIRLANPADPCILLPRGDIAAFLRWALSLGVQSVFVEPGADALVAHGTVPDPEITLAVRVEVEPGRVTAAGLCGVVALADLTVLVGKPVAR